MADMPKKSAAALVVAALKGIPDSIKDLFVPVSSDALKLFEQNVIKFHARAKDRDEVMALQRKYGLPLRPNMSYVRTMILVRLCELKRKRQSPPPSSTDSPDTP